MPTKKNIFDEPDGFKTGTKTIHNGVCDWGSKRPWYSGSIFASYLTDCEFESYPSWKIPKTKKNKKEARKGQTFVIEGTFLCQQRFGTFHTFLAIPSFWNSPCFVNCTFICSFSIQLNDFFVFMQIQFISVYSFIGRARLWGHGRSIGRRLSPRKALKLL